MLNDKPKPRQEALICGMSANGFHGAVRITCQSCKGGCYTVPSRYHEGMYIICVLCARKGKIKLSPQAQKAVDDYYRDITN